MKRIYKLSYACLFILLLPALLSAQDKKSEQKIKVIRDDGTGAKVVVDTLITGDMISDSLKLKDGTVIYLEHDGDRSYRMHPSENKHFFITTDSSSDSHRGRNRERYTVVTRNSREHGMNGDVIYINKEKVSDKGSDNKYDIYVTDSDRDSTVNKTKYVIAKDGMVVTVEGNDEARTKDLIKVIENKLGVTSERTDNKGTVKAEAKKAEKK